MSLNWPLDRHQAEFENVNHQSGTSTKQRERKRSEALGASGRHIPGDSENDSRTDYESYAGGPGGLDAQPIPLSEETTAIPTARVASDHDWLIPDYLSDNDFEELCRLGEGRVHRVRHKQTGLILARKTISIPNVPNPQFARGLSVTADANHPNIIRFFGVYKSPGLHEIKVLIEFCDGRSLDDVRKQIVALDAVVGEKVYGRLAEGVRSHS